MDNYSLQMLMQGTHVTYDTSHYRMKGFFFLFFFFSLQSGKLFLSFPIAFFFYLTKVEAQSHSTVWTGLNF